MYIAPLSRLKIWIYQIKLTIIYFCLIKAAFVIPTRRDKTESRQFREHFYISCRKGCHSTVNLLKHNPNKPERVVTFRSRRCITGKCKMNYLWGTYSVLTFFWWTNIINVIALIYKYHEMHFYDLIHFGPIYNRQTLFAYLHAAFRTPFQIKI